MLLGPLRDLAAKVPGPAHAKGRSRIPMTDTISCGAFKVYLTVSSRRFMTDVREARGGPCAEGMARQQCAELHRRGIAYADPVQPRGRERGTAGVRRVYVRSRLQRCPLFADLVCEVAAEQKNTSPRLARNAPSHKVSLHTKRPERAVLCKSRPSP